MVSGSLSHLCGPSRPEPFHAIASEVISATSINDAIILFFAEAPPKTFFSRITKDIEIVRVVLLLTGSIEGAKDQVAHFVNGFARYRIYNKTLCH